MDFLSHSLHLCIYDDVRSVPLTEYFIIAHSTALRRYISEQIRYVITFITC